MFIVQIDTTQCFYCPQKGPSVVLLDPLSPLIRMSFGTSTLSLVRVRFASYVFALHAPVRFFCAESPSQAARCWPHSHCMDGKKNTFSMSLTDLLQVINRLMLGAGNSTQDPEFGVHMLTQNKLADLFLTKTACHWSQSTRISVACPPMTFLLVVAHLKLLGNPLYLRIFLKNCCQWE